MSVLAVWLPIMHIKTSEDGLLTLIGYQCHPCWHCRYLPPACPWHPPGCIPSPPLILPQNILSACLRAPAGAWHSIDMCVEPWAAFACYFWHACYIAMAVSSAAWAFCWLSASSSLWCPDRIQPLMYFEILFLTFIFRLQKYCIETFALVELGKTILHMKAVLRKWFLIFNQQLGQHEWNPLRKVVIAHTVGVLYLEIQLFMDPWANLAGAYRDKTVPTACNVSTQPGGDVKCLNPRASPIPAGAHRDSAAACWSTNR